MMKAENLRYQNYENGWNSTQQMTLLSAEATGIQDSKLQDSRVFDQYGTYSGPHPTTHGQQQAWQNGKENRVTFRENPSKARRDDRQSKTESQGHRKLASDQCTTVPFQGQVMHENVAIVRHYLQTTGTNNNQQVHPYQEQRSYDNRSSFAHTRNVPNDFLAVSAHSVGSFNNGGNSFNLGDQKQRRVKRDISRDYLARTAIKQNAPAFSIVSSNKPPMNPLQSIKPKAYITKQMSIDCRSKHVVVSTSEKPKFERVNSKHQLQPKQLDFNLQQNQYEPDAQPLVSPTFSDVPRERCGQRRDSEVVLPSGIGTPSYTPNMTPNNMPTPHLDTYQNSMLNHAMHQFQAGGGRKSGPKGAAKSRGRLSLSKKKVSIQENPIEVQSPGRCIQAANGHVRCSSLLSNGSLKSILSNPTLAKISPMKANAFSSHKKSFSGFPLNLSALNIHNQSNYHEMQEPQNLSKLSLKQYKTTLKKRKSQISHYSTSALKLQNKQKTIQPSNHTKHSRNAPMAQSGTTQSILSNNAKKYQIRNNSTTEAAQQQTPSVKKLPNNKDINSTYKPPNNASRPASRSKRPGSSQQQMKPTQSHNYQTNRNDTNSKMRVRVGSAVPTVAPSQQQVTSKAKRNNNSVLYGQSTKSKVK